VFTSKRDHHSLSVGETVTRRGRRHVKVVAFNWEQLPPRPATTVAGRASRATVVVQPLVQALLEFPSGATVVAPTSIGTSHKEATSLKETTSSGTGRAEAADGLRRPALSVSITPVDMQDPDSITLVGLHRTAHGRWHADLDNRAGEVGAARL
jgi:hypothetical protein